MHGICVFDRNNHKHQTFHTEIVHTEIVRTEMLHLKRELLLPSNPLRFIYQMRHILFSLSSSVVYK